MDEIWTMALAKKAHQQHRADGGVKSFRQYVREYMRGYDCRGKLARIARKK